LKQSSRRMKKVLSILFAVLFVASLTAVTVSAKGGSYWSGGWGGYPWWGYGYPYHAYPADTGLPYMMGQYSAPATSIQAPTPVASTQASAPA
jgi:hypothetical protein